MHFFLLRAPPPTIPDWLAQSHTALLPVVNRGYIVGAFICLVGRSPWLDLWVCQQNGTWHCLALITHLQIPARGIRGVSRPTTGSPNRRNMAEVRIGISRRPCPPWGEHNSFLCVETYKKSLCSWGEIERLQSARVVETTMRRRHTVLLWREIARGQKHNPVCK